MSEIVLVTGGTGLVGSAIKKISCDYNYEFVFMSSKTCNLLNYEETIYYFNVIKPKYVIHLAANVGGLFKNMNKPVDMLEDNLLINSNVLKAAHNIQVKKLIACLSTCIFPDKVTYPIKEEYLHAGEPHYSNAAYAYAKRILQVQCESYNKQYGDNFVCVIPTNIYGLHDNFHLEDAHVIPALIHKCFIAKNNNEDFVVAGSGKPLRQFIFSEDLAKMIMWSLFNCDEKMIILSPDDEVSIKHVAECIARKFNYDKIVFDTTKADGQYKKTVSNELFRKYNSEFVFENFDNGVGKVIEWFVNNYDSVRK